MNSPGVARETVLIDLCSLEISILQGEAELRHFLGIIMLKAVKHFVLMGVSNRDLDLAFTALIRRTCHCESFGI